MTKAVHTILYSRSSHGNYSLTAFVILQNEDLNNPSHTPEQSSLVAIKKKKSFFILREDSIRRARMDY